LAFVASSWVKCILPHYPNTDSVYILC